MSNYSNASSYLVSFADSEDIKRVDEAIFEKKLGLEKLGEKTYLAFVFETPLNFHLRLKVDHQVVGKTHWIRLPAAEVMG